jgi:hypothetical protein
MTATRISSQSGIDYLIALHIMHFDEAIDQLSVLTGNSESFKGWNSLTLESNPTNIIVDGSADFTARTEVNIRSEFTASLNSEVHIFTSETFNDCVDYTNYHAPKIRRNNKSNLNDNGLIELNFRVTDDFNVTVFPNPSNQTININLFSENNKNDIYTYLISDFNGKVIFQQSAKNSEYRIDISSFSKGIYSLTVLANTFIKTKKIIIQ